MFCQRDVDSKIPINSGIPDSLSCIPDISKAQDPGFHSKNLLDSRNKKEKFPSFWNQDGAIDWKLHFLEFRLVETHLSTQATQREK